MHNTKIGVRGWLGNPYPLGPHTRLESIALYRRAFNARIAGEPLFKAAVDRLYASSLLVKDFRLGCFCKPEACHVDVILEYFATLDELRK